MHAFSVNGLSVPFRVARFTGEEGLSRLFQFEITVVCPEGDAALGAVVGRRARLTIGSGERSRVVDGVVSRFEQSDAGRSFTECRATLVPWAWRLKQRTDARIFQGLSAPDIIRDVLGRGGLFEADRRAHASRAQAHLDRFQLALRATYRPREVCVQYLESDWDFISRLMEEEGIFYFFTREDDAELLVISDGPFAHQPIDGGAPLPFRPDLGALSGGERLSRFRFAEEVRPSRVTLRDYSFLAPQIELEASADSAKTALPSPHADAEEGGLEVYEYPGDYDQPGAGARLASVRLEELRAPRRTAEGESDCVRLAPGRSFHLVNHPRDELNAEYILTNVHHWGAEPVPGVTSTEPAYANRLRVIPSGAPFRPPRATPRPSIRGVQTAIVVGPPGEEIHTDAHGRVKVRFHWDRSGRRDDRCSCWIRVSQMSAGGAFGAVFLPRVGHEVVVDFINGDPDQPLIIGSVYHAANVPPVALPGDRSKSTIKSSTYPGGVGSNELRFDDAKGAEEVYLHGERDLTIDVKNDKDQTIGGDESLLVKGSRTVTVAEAHTETIALAQTITVGAALTQTVGAVMSLNVGGAKIELVGAASDETVVGKKSSRVGFSYSLKAGSDVTMRAGKSAAIKAGLDAAVEAGKDVNVEAGKAMNLSSGAGMTLEAQGPLTVETPKSAAITVGEASEEKVGKTKTLIVGEKVAIQCGSTTIELTKDGKVTITGTSITLKSNDPILVDGKNVDVKAKGDVSVQTSGNVKVKGGNVGIN